MFRRYQTGRATVRRSQKLSKFVNLRAPRDFSLGNLRFIMYVKGLLDCLSFLGCQQHADDTSITVSGDNITAANQICTVIRLGITNIAEST